jgi:hypothetical protein
VTILIAQHTTDRHNLASIMRSGLVPRRPHDFNWAGYTEQPTGVYVIPIPNEPWFVPDDVVLRVAYVGPAVTDPLVIGALCLLDSVPPHAIEVAS